MTAPALRRLRERFPEAQLSLLTHRNLEGLWRYQSCVDEVLTFGPGENPFRIGSRLRVSGFDTALVMPNSPRSALEVWAAGIPRRVGYGGRWRKWFLTEAVPDHTGVMVMRKRGVREIKRLVQEGRAEAASQVGDPSAAASHHVHHYLRLTAALGAEASPVAPGLEVEEVEAAAASARLLAESAAANPGAPGVFLGLNPSAAYGDAKRWPAENFAAAIREVCRQHPEAKWVGFGGPDDAQLCERIGELADTRIINLAGKTSLRELMALLKACRLLLTNDSGPMHVAAALGVPVVAPFGSTSPELTGPLSGEDTRHVVLKSNAVCAPCFRRTCPIDFRCMKGITAGQVTAAVMGLLQGPEHR